MKEFTAQGHYIFQRNRVAHVGKFPSDLEASHAAACLNACHHVPDPEVTIPALVEALSRASDLLSVVDTGAQPDVGQQNWYDTRSGLLLEIRALLSKLNPSEP